MRGLRDVAGGLSRLVGDAVHRAPREAAPVPAPAPFPTGGPTPTSTGWGDRWGGGSGERSDAPSFLDDLPGADRLVPSGSHRRP